MHEDSQPKVENSMPTENLLDYIAGFGDDIARYAREAKAMLEIAQTRGFEVDLEILRKYQLDGSQERLLIAIRAEVLGIKTAIAEYGVEVTRNELEAKMHAQIPTDKGSSGLRGVTVTPF